MITRGIVLLIFLTPACGFALTAQLDGQPLKQQPPPKVDLYGDPLPEGAFARLGSVRFRHTNATSIIYSPDGKYLATAGGPEFGICIWEAATGQPLHRIIEPSRVNEIAFSPDSKLLVDEFLNVFDVATGTKVRQLTRPDFDIVSCVVFSPDGKRIAAAGRLDGNRLAIECDAVTGKETARITGKVNGYRSILFAADGKCLAVAVEDKNLSLWDVATRQEVWCFKHDEAVIPICVSPNGKELATWDNGGFISLWSLEKGTLLGKHKTGALFARTIAFSPDGKRLVLVEDWATESIIDILDSQNAKEIISWKTRPFTDLAFSPDGKTLATVGSDSAIRRWNLATGKEINPPTDHTTPIYSLFFSDEGKRILSSDRSPSMIEWHLPFGKERRLLIDGFLPSSAETADYLDRIHLSHDGTMAAVLGAAGGLGNRKMAIFVWNIPQKKELYFLKGQLNQIESLHFSPDRKWLACSADNGIHIWDAGTGKEIHHIEALRSRPFIFSPDSKQLAWAGLDGMLHFCEVASGKDLREWASRDVGLCPRAFSPDGKLLASTDADFNVSVWDAVTGKRLVRVGHHNWIESVAFSPSGRVLAIAGTREWTRPKGDPLFRQTIDLWEVHSGQEIRFILSPQGAVSSVAFAPDGRTLASGGSDSTILLWDLAHHATPGRLAAKDLDRLWSDLAGDAPAADRAIWTLSLSPKESFPLLKERLKPTPPADPQQLANLLEALDSKQYAARQQAAKTLDDLGEAAEAFVRKTLSGNPTLEVKGRLEQFLQKREKDVIRKLRALEALEHIATPEARDLLQALAKESPNPRIAQAATAAVQRLAKRVP